MAQCLLLAEACRHRRPEMGKQLSVLRFHEPSSQDSRILGHSVLWGLAVSRVLARKCHCLPGGTVRQDSRIPSGGRQGYPPHLPGTKGSLSKGIYEAHMTWNPKSYLLSLNLVAALAGLFAGCQSKQPPLPTVKGPEATGLLDQVSGYIVMDEPPGGIRAISLPDRKEIVVRSGSHDLSPIHSLSGPDAMGRIAYFEYSTDDSHRLKCIRLDGSGDRVIFEAPGDPIWDHTVGAPALAPRGGMVSFVRNRKPGSRGREDRIIGPLEMLGSVE